MLFVAIALITCIPFTALVPVHAPEAMQLVAFVLLQERVEAPVPLLGTVVGFALIVTVGSGATVTVVEALAEIPPIPEHVNV